MPVPAITQQQVEEVAVDIDTRTEEYLEEARKKIADPTYVIQSVPATLAFTIMSRCQGVDCAREVVRQYLSGVFISHLKSL